LASHAAREGRGPHDKRRFSMKIRSTIKAGRTGEGIKVYIDVVY
jgi:hypothetical protein